jgi:hypothetical protein
MSLVAPYCGQTQQSQILVAASPKSVEREEGPWVIPPYALLFPQESGEAWVPPPVKQTDIFTAQQTWPL